MRLFPSDGERGTTEIGTDSCAAFNEPIYGRTPLTPLSDLKLTALRAVKILGTARPGETLRIQVRITGRLGPLVQAEGEAFVSGKKVLAVELTLSGSAVA